MSAPKPAKELVRAEQNEVELNCDFYGGHRFSPVIHGGEMCVYCCAPNPENCPYCDGTGDVHRADGEWLGQCTCGAEPAAL